MLELCVASLQVRLILQHVFDIQHGAVFGLFPTDEAVTKLRAASIAHGLLQGLLELGFELFLLGNRLTHGQQIGKAG